VPILLREDLAQELRGGGDPAEAAAGRRLEGREPARRGREAASRGITFSAPTYISDAGGPPSAAGSAGRSCSFAPTSFLIIAAALTISLSPWPSSLVAGSRPMPPST
jgi:hypothetical protein